jgi:hypothetical protein
MRVDLRELKPNPMRDFIVDPIDDETVERLRASIEEDGFWGGIVCRQIENGDIEIGAGHHRVKAAVLAGVTSADVHVRNGDMDDAAMVRVYARENATQRGNSGTAQAGSVASAIRFIAKAVMSGCAQEFLRSSDVDKIRGNLTGNQGIGHSVIVRFLDGVPGICESTVQQALANLKASGDYARIIREVQEEIERENAESLAALAKAEAEQREAEEREQEAERERKEAAAKAKAARADADKKRAELERQRTEAEAKLAEKRRKEADAQLEQFEAMKKTRDTAAKATEASARKPITFDFEGVSKHLKNPHQIDVFRERVTNPNVAAALPVNQQAKLAAELVRLAKDRDVELSGTFIKENIATLLFGAKTEARAMTKEEKERIEREDVQQRAKTLMNEMGWALRTFVKKGTDLANLLKRWPKGLVFPIDNSLRKAIDLAKPILQSLNERI